MSRTSTTTQPKQASASATSQATPMTSVPMDKVAKLAYDKWMKGGCKHGCDKQHWFEAEAEVRAEMAKSGKK